MDFLDDTYRLGLLRTVGPAYQFRHAEFQDHRPNRWHVGSNGLTQGARPQDTGTPSERPDLP
jgi:hypothetical protein